ncbi:hypothetical protein BK010_00520 [Tenericutes bacterium MO-XQ]|nr:hypothetical protein BK010_00520 [Tenericutes bacterium MO-XQ]
MKKILLVICLLGSSIFFVSCTSITSGGKDEFEDFSYINRIDISDEMAAHFDSDDFKYLDYISNDLLIYHYTHASTNSLGQISVEQRFNVVTNTGYEAFSAGSRDISTYLGYDQEQNTIYFLNPEEYPYQIQANGQTAIDELEFDPPVSFMTTSYFGSLKGVYDFRGNSYHRNLFSEQIIPFKYDMGDDVIFFSYIYGEGEIYGYNLTEGTTMDVITLKDDLLLNNFIYSNSDYAIIELKFGGYISINKEGEIQYFLRDEHKIDGYNGLLQDIYTHHYPYLEYEEIDGDNDLNVVSDLSFSTFITVAQDVEVAYLDQDIHILLEGDTYNYYQNDEIVYSVKKTGFLFQTQFYRYNNYLVYQNNANQTTIIYDMDSQEVATTLKGTAYFSSQNIYAYAPKDSEDKIVLYDIDNQSERIIDINGLSEKRLFSIEDGYFIIYDDKEVTLYNIETLEFITLNYISELTRVSYESPPYYDTYGLLVEYKDEYYLIG